MCLTIVPEKAPLVFDEKGERIFFKVLTEKWKSPYFSATYAANKTFNSNRRIESSLHHHHRKELDVSEITSREVHGGVHVLDTLEAAVLVAQRYADQHLQNMLVVEILGHQNNLVATGNFDYSCYPSTVFTEVYVTDKMIEIKMSPAAQAAYEAELAATNYDDEDEDDWEDYDEEDDDWDGDFDDDDDDDEDEDLDEEEDEPAATTAP